MKKTKIILSAVLCVFATQSSFKAQGLYFGLGAGYGFPAAKSGYVSYKSVSSSSTSSSTEYVSHPYSFGSGVNAGLYAGYMFNSNIGAELGLSYLMGGKYDYTNESTNTPGKTSTLYKSTLSGSMFRIIPALRMTAGEGKLKPYMKVGLIIGMAGKVTEEYMRDNTNPVGKRTVEESTTEYSGGLSLGFHGGLGITYMFSDKLGIFGELAGNYQNWAPGKSVITKATQDGVDVLSAMDTRDKETEYLDSYTTDNNATVNDNAPSKSTPIFMPFSSIGINIGVHFTLGGGGDK
jgi:outer membrane protein W